MENRLYRSRTDRVIAGICGGLGRYLGVDPTLVRLFFILLLLLGKGAGLLIYIVLWIAIPPEPRGENGGAEYIGPGREAMVGPQGEGYAAERRREASIVVGAGLILLGILFLLQNLNIAWLHWVAFDLLWPLLLVAGGLALIWRRLKGEA